MHDELTKKDIEKHINTFSKVYPSILPNLSNKNMIDKNEKIEVAICPIQDIIKVFPYSNKDFKCIERYFKYNFNFLPPIHLVLLILKVAYSSFSFLK